MKHLYFVRHGQTEWNAIARMQGQWNSDLSALGQAQARVSGQVLSGFPIDAMYASPLDRTRQTAALINEHLDLPVTFDERIMEWDCGDWSGYLYAEVAEKWKAEWQAYQQDKFHYRGPNCENYPDMFARARPFLQEVLATSHEHIAIVSHGMIGKVMIAELLGMDEDETLAISQPNDVIMVVRVDEGGRDVFHYVGEEGPIAGPSGRPTQLSA